MVPSPGRNDPCPRPTRHSRDWPDRPLPALGGRAPRRAVAMPRWPPAPVDLLEWMEKREARAAPSGPPAFDSGWLGDEPGLPRAAPGARGGA
jgi:hypothetical protein